MERITDLNHPPVVGETYLVPCTKRQHGKLIPVIGGFHDDGEIGFFVEHVHPDFRFFDDKEFETILKKTVKDGESLHSVVYRPFKTNHLVWESKKCYREQPKYPIEIYDSDLMQALEDIYSKGKLNCDTCPHQGAHLGSIAPNSDGNKVCPLHGLMWTSDGSLVPRFGD